MMINKRLLREVPQAKTYIWKQVFLQWLGLLMNIVLIFILAQLFEKLWLKELQSEQMPIYGFSIVVLIAFRMFFTKKSMEYSFLASADVKNTLRSRLYRKLLELKNTHTQYVSTSELVQLSVEGIDQLETYFGRYVPQFFYSMIAPITLFSILVWIDYRSALILLFCVPLIPLSIVAVQKFAKKLLSKYWTSYASLGDSFLENLQGLTTLKIYQADEYKNEEMNKEAENFRNITMKVLMMQLNSVSVMDIVAYGGAAAGCIAAVTSLLHQQVGIAGATAIVLLSSEFFIPLRLLGSYFHIAMNGIAASDKIFRILDIKMDDGSTQKFDHTSFPMVIDKLCFSYDEQREILHDIQMKVKQGEFVAVVGESGCGKSTLAKLIMGLEKQYEGKIQFHQQERSSLYDDSFFAQVTYITHNAMIFKGTVRENLLMAKQDADDEEMNEVLKQVCLYEFLQQEQGLDTRLEENGNNFSGGQRQRLAIARALLKGSDFYIFDEATSNIDVESETAILQVIHNLAKHKTMLMITHRLSTVTGCDNVFVMKDGTIAEHGSHTELLKRKGIYAHMYEQQMELEQLRGGAEHAG